MSWWPFPPSTREVQFDEKWSFVHTKQKNCDPTDPADDHHGDYWDFVAYDPEHRLVLAVIPGARTEENGAAIVEEVAGRLGGASPELMTSDENPVYETAIRDTFGEPVPAERKPGRPRVVPERRVPEGVVDATVHKHRQNGRVVAVEPRSVFGSEEELEEALGESCASSVVNTSFIERQNATDRHRNARKIRTYV
jgi:IS1 family transposase